MKSEKPVIFFDGVCGLCHGFVRFILKRDTKGKFLFSPLQGETAKSSNLRSVGGSIVLLEEGVALYGSDAVIRTVSELGGLWRFARVLMLVPSLVREFVYNYIAARRYKWFGKFDECGLPDAEHTDRFLP